MLDCEAGCKTQGEESSGEADAVKQEGTEKAGTLSGPGRQRKGRVVMR